MGVMDFNERYTAYMNRVKDARPRFEMPAGYALRFDSVCPMYERIEVADPSGSKSPVTVGYEDAYAMRFFKGEYGDHELKGDALRAYMGAGPHDVRAEQFRQLHADCVEAGSLFLDLRNRTDGRADQMRRELAGPLLERWQALTVSDEYGSMRMGMENLGMLSQSGMHDLVMYIQAGADAHGAVESGLAGKPDPECDAKCNRLTAMAREGAYRFMNAYMAPDDGVHTALSNGIGEFGNEMAVRMMQTDDGRERPEIRFSDFRFALPDAPGMMAFNSTYLDSMAPGVGMFNKRILSEPYRQRVAADMAERREAGIEPGAVTQDVIPNNLYYSMTGKTRDMALRDMAAGRDSVPGLGFNGRPFEAGYSGHLADYPGAGPVSADNPVRGDSPMFDGDFTGSSGALSKAGYVVPDPPRITGPVDRPRPVRQAPPFGGPSDGNGGGGGDGLGGGPGGGAGASMDGSDSPGRSGRSTRDLDAAFDGLDGQDYEGPHGPDLDGECGI